MNKMITEEVRLVDVMREAPGFVKFISEALAQIDASIRIIRPNYDFDSLRRIFKRDGDIRELALVSRKRRRFDTNSNL